MRSIIIGAGTYGEVYLSYLKEAGVEIIGFLDDNPALIGKKISEIPVLGNIEILPELKETYGIQDIYCPLGNNRLRVKLLEWAKALGYNTPNFIHKKVILAPNVNIGEDGVYILPNTLVMPKVEIDNFVMISCGSNVIHHSKLKKGVFVSNGVNLGASLTACECAYIGMGATVMTGVKKLGKDCLIGAGACVIRDVPDGAVMAGVPAKIIKFKQEYGEAIM